MESYFDLRKRGLKAIVEALREIDDYNLTNENAKILDKVKFISEIKQEFSISDKKAKEWLEECLKYNKSNHEYMLNQEAIIRGIKIPSSEVKKQLEREADAILDEQSIGETADNPGV